MRDGDEVRGTDWTLGVFLEDNSAQAGREKICQVLTQEHLVKRVQDAEAVFAAHYFKMARKTWGEPPEGMIRQTCYAPFQEMMRYAFCLYDNATVVRSAGVIITPKYVKEYHDLVRAGNPPETGHPTMFNLPGAIAGGYDHYHPMTVPWPPFMAFALLHCKNVTAETHRPEPAAVKHCQKYNVPARVTYRTLRLELPEESTPRAAPAGQEPSGRKVRFHLVRGHFKNLQHERYKDKGWHWWPAHWKGSPDLGRVEKHYELHGRDPAEACSRGKR
jgi:hypothetical protein